MHIHTMLPNHVQLKSHVLQNAHVMQNVIKRNFHNKVQYEIASFNPYTQLFIFKCNITYLTLIALSMIIYASNKIFNVKYFCPSVHQRILWCS